MSDWILVTERLPEDTRLVNVALGETVVSTAHYNHGKKLWRPFNSFTKFYPAGFVTHWTPLPEPPEKL